jgi:hypothetical protein
MESDLSDPDVWFNELTNIRNMMKEVPPAIVLKNDTTMALKIVANLVPACYMSVHSSLIQTQSIGDLEVMKNCARAHYKAFIKGKNPDQVAMVNYAPPAERRLNRREKGGKDKSKIKCFNCGKTGGHRKQECYEEWGGSYDSRKQKAISWTTR